MDVESQVRERSASMVLVRNAQVGKQLSTGVSDERLDPEPAGTRDLRDRAFTYLDELVNDVRSAGRYAFRGEPAVAKRFASRYRRRQRTGGRRGETETQVVEEEVVGETDCQRWSVTLCCGSPGCFALAEWPGPSASLRRQGGRWPAE